MKQKTNYWRIGNKIIGKDKAGRKNNSCVVKDCASINEAKRVSRKMQIESDGALGLGSVQRG